MTSKLRIYPFEWLTLGAVVATTVVLAVLGAEVTAASVFHTLSAMARLPLALVVGIAVYAYYHYARGGELKPYLRQLATASWLLLGVRLWLACLIVSFCYFWVKVHIPMLNPRSWDAELAALDRWLHFGALPSELAIRLLAGTSLIDWLDWWYHLWITTVIWTLAFFVASDDSVVRRRVMCAAVLLWITGVIVYIAIPARGPIYAYQEMWAGVAGSMPRAESVQLQLEENYEAVLATRGGNPRPFNHLFGVAALPSLHVAFHFMFGLMAWRHARVLFAPFLVMTLLTQIGAVLTGWHYAVDGYVGMLLAWVCYRLALWLEREESFQGGREEGGERNADC